MAGLWGRADRLVRAIVANRAGDSAEAERFIAALLGAHACSAGRCALAAHRSLAEEALAGELAELETSKVPDLQKKGRPAKIREVVRLRRWRVQAEWRARPVAHEHCGHRRRVVRPSCAARYSQTVARRQTRRPWPTNFFSMLLVRRRAHGN